jgi:hypothetical protein
MLNNLPILIAVPTGVESNITPIIIICILAIGAAAAAFFLLRKK